MKIVFFGLNEFGFESLKKLIENKFIIGMAVIPINNKNKNLIRLVKQNRIKLFLFNNNLEDLKKEIFKIKPALIIISSFNKILPSDIIYFPKLGSINIHPSLLPKYRGAHPINWALINGEKKTGVTIHYVNEKADDGEIITQKSLLISDNDDINTLKNKLAKLGGQLLVKVIKKIKKTKGKLPSTKQDSRLVTLAPKRTPEQGRIDWKKRSKEIFNLVRALKTPLPNAFSYKNNVRIEFFDNFISNRAGEVIAKVKGFYLITTTDGLILLKTKQKLNIGDILN